jgi:hypothetical protein
MLLLPAAGTSEWSGRVRHMAIFGGDALKAREQAAGQWFDVLEQLPVMHRHLPIRNQCRCRQHAVAIGSAVGGRSPR